MVWGYGGNPCATEGSTHPPLSLLLLQRPPLLPHPSHSFHLPPASTCPLDKAQLCQDPQLPPAEQCVPHGRDVACRMDAISSPTCRRPRWVLSTTSARCGRTPSRVGRPSTAMTRFAVGGGWWGFLLGLWCRRTHARLLPRALSHPASACTLPHPMPRQARNPRTALANTAAWRCCTPRPKPWATTATSLTGAFSLCATGPRERVGGGGGAVAGGGGVTRCHVKGTTSPPKPPPRV